jgi:hypothetical protein
MPEGAPAIFLAIGAMKSGTTWLYELLRRHPDCALSPVKELHFFEALYAPQPDYPQYYAQYFERAAELARTLAADVSGALARRGRSDGALFEDGFLRELNVDERAAELAAHAELLRVRDVPSYVAYFERLRERQGAAVAGEMTATYADLPAAALRDIAARIPGVRLIFVMRDPVERFWSHARFDAGRAGESAAALEARLDALLDDPLLLPRSDYRAVITKLDEAVPRAQVLYAFYERLVEPATAVGEIRRLERFLGLAPLGEPVLREFVGRRINVSPAADLPAPARARIELRLAAVYDFVAARFGGMPPGWAEVSGAR